MKSSPFSVEAIFGEIRHSLSFFGGRAVETLCVVLLLSASSLAGDLNIAIESEGSSSIVVGPGDTVGYAVVGELTAADSQGLALFTLDLSFNGGALASADSPAAFPMVQFASPMGLNNPGGYGGTPLAGGLTQVGGGQNTINNTQGAVLLGSVVTGVALLGSPETLVTGVLTAPAEPGTYVLSVANVDANVVVSSSTGMPFWAVEEAGVGTITPLTVSVQATLTRDVESLSVATGGTQTLSLDAGSANSGATYFLLGSISGTEPGIPLAGGVVLPLNVDFYFDFTFANPNSPLLSNSFGTLDVDGRATATFNLPAGVNPAAIGVILHHAYTFITEDFVSNAVSVELEP